MCLSVFGCASDNKKTDKDDDKEKTETNASDSSAETSDGVSGVVSDKDNVSEESSKNEVSKDDSLTETSKEEGSEDDGSKEEDEEDEDDRTEATVSYPELDPEYSAKVYGIINGGEIAWEFVEALKNNGVTTELSYYENDIIPVHEVIDVYDIGKIKSMIKEHYLSFCTENYWSKHRADINTYIDFCFYEESGKVYFGYPVISRMNFHVFVSASPVSDDGVCYGTFYDPILGREVSAKFVYSGGKYKFDSNV